jgi:hypothetical protein
MPFGETRLALIRRWPGVRTAVGQMADLVARVFSIGGRTAFPEWVVRDIERQQEAGEIIVGWTQAAVIVFFGALYAVSPKAFPARAWPNPSILSCWRNLPASGIEPPIVGPSGLISGSRMLDRSNGFSPSR